MIQQYYYIRSESKLVKLQREAPNLKKKPRVFGTWTTRVTQPKNIIPNRIPEPHKTRAIGSLLQESPVTKPKREDHSEQ